MVSLQVQVPALQLDQFRMGHERILFFPGHEFGHGIEQATRWHGNVLGEFRRIHGTQVRPQCIIVSRHAQAFGSDMIGVVPPLFQK